MVELAAGTEIAGYRIEGVAGRGGMGIVYRARQLALDRTVAFKVIAPRLARDEAFRARFKRESRIAASIRNPHVVTVYDAREEGEMLFIAMDYIAGTDLRAEIAARGRLDPRRAANIVGQAAEGLGAAHRRGLVHRDVKPANILLAEETTGERAYITDFGVAKDIEASGGATTAGSVLGTFDYTAPEQLEAGPVDARTDVYALGCVLFHALTGEVPFPRPSVPAKVRAHVNDAPRPVTAVVPELPAALDAVVLRALAKDPERRYATAAELGAAAVAAAGQAAPGVAAAGVAKAQGAREGPPTAPTRRMPPPPPRARRRWVPWAIGGGVALAGVVAAALLLGGADDGGKATADRAATRAETVTRTVETTPTQPGVPVPDSAYAGTTSQGKEIHFTVEGGAAGAIRFTETVRCRSLDSGEETSVDNDFVGLSTTRGQVSRQGTFDIDVRLPEQTFRMQGAFADGEWSGALRHVYDADSGGGLTLGRATARCDSDQITYTASG